MHASGLRPDIVCCSALNQARSCCPTARLRTLADYSPIMLRRFDDVMYANDARIEQCDNAAANGVVHIVDEVILS